jgi:hypothetical protein
MKEKTNLPSTYFNLTVDQQAFIDSFFEKIEAQVSTKQEAIKSIKRIRDALNNIDFEIDYIESEYFEE